MSVFETRRTENSDYRLDRMRATAKIRKNNFRALTEGKDDGVKIGDNSGISDAVSDLDAKMAKIDDEEKMLSDAKESLNRMRIRQSKISTQKELIALENRLFKENADTVFEVGLFNIVYDACWIDESVKRNTISNMYQCFLETLDTLDMLNVPRKIEGPFLVNMKQSALEITKEACKRIADECKENCTDDTSADDIQQIDFSLSDNETTDFDEDINDLGKEDIVQLVKDKVLSVVQDEKRAGQAKSEAIDSIKQDLDNTDENGDVAASPAEPDDTEDNNDVKESFNRILETSRKRNINKKFGSSLFECIMTSSYKNIIEALDTVTEVDDGNENGNTSKDQKTAAPVNNDNSSSTDDPNKNSLLAAAKRRMGAQKAARTRVAKAVNKKDKDKGGIIVGNPSTPNTTPTKEQMVGAAMQEAVLVYTTLETVGTLGLYDFTPRTVSILKEHYKSLMK